MPNIRARVLPRKWESASRIWINKTWGTQQWCSE